MASAAVTVEANLFAFFQHLSRWPRVELHDEPDCCWTLSELPFPLFNSVMRARRPDDRIDALIDARIADCEARNVAMLWWTGPSTMPADIGERLDRCGFVLEAARGMAADLEDHVGPRGRAHFDEVDERSGIVPRLGGLIEEVRGVSRQAGAPDEVGDVDDVLAGGVVSPGDIGAGLAVLLLLGMGGRPRRAEDRGGQTDRQSEPIHMLTISPSPWRIQSLS